MSTNLEQLPPLAWVFYSGAASISVEPYPGRPGVLVCGVDPGEPLDHDTEEAVRQALDTWKVLFFQRPREAVSQATSVQHSATIDR